MHIFPIFSPCPPKPLDICSQAYALLVTEKPYIMASDNNFQTIYRQKWVVLFFYSLTFVQLFWDIEDT